MIFKKSKTRNANMARNSFVTRRAETRLNALTDLFKAASGKHWSTTTKGLLKRTLFFSDFHHLDSLQLIYNWENRFMSVNYNLQMLATFFVNEKFEKTEDTLFTLSCKQKGIKGKREYTWETIVWKEDEAKLDQYMKRLHNPILLERLEALDILEMEIRHEASWDHWTVSCESLIGSATWILIPPVLSMITPKLDECVKFYELYALLGDALVNNRK